MKKSSVTFFGNLDAASERLAANPLHRSTVRFFGAMTATFTSLILEVPTELCQASFASVEAMAGIWSGNGKLEHESSDNRYCSRVHMVVPCGMAHNAKTGELSCPFDFSFSAGSEEESNGSGVSFLATKSLDLGDFQTVAAQEDETFVCQVRSPLDLDTSSSTLPDTKSKVPLTAIQREMQREMGLTSETCRLRSEEPKLWMTATVKLSRAIGQHGYDKASDFLKDSQVLVELQLKMVEFRLPGGNRDRIQPTEGPRQYHGLPPFARANVSKGFTMGGEASELVALRHTELGWGYVFSKPIFVPVTFFDDHDTPRAFLSKLVKISIDDVGQDKKDALCPWSNPGTRNVVIASQRLDVSRFLSRDNKHSEFEVEFKGDDGTIGPAYVRLGLSLITNRKRIDDILNIYNQQRKFAAQRTEDLLKQQNALNLDFASKLGVVLVHFQTCHLLGIGSEMTDIRIRLRAGLGGDKKENWVQLVCIDPFTHAMLNSTSIEMNLSEELHVAIFAKRHFGQIGAFAAHALPLSDSKEQTQDLVVATTSFVPASMIDTLTRAGRAKWQLPKVSALARVVSALTIAVNINYDRSNQAKKQQQVSSASGSLFNQEAKRSLNLKEGQVLLRVRVVGINTVYGKAHKLDKLLGTMGVRFSRRGLSMSSSLVDRNYDNSISESYNEYNFGDSQLDGEDLLIPVSLVESTTEDGKFDSKFLKVELLARPEVAGSQLKKGLVVDSMAVAEVDFDLADHISCVDTLTNNIRVGFKGNVPPGPTGTTWKWELRLEFEIHNSMESLGEELFYMRATSQGYIALGGQEKARKTPKKVPLELPKSMLAP